LATKTRYFFTGGKDNGQPFFPPLKNGLIPKRAAFIILHADKMGVFDNHPSGRFFMKKSIALLVLWGVFSFKAVFAQWGQSNGPDGGPVSLLSVNTGNGYIFAVANGGGFRSTDEGASWTPVLNGLPANFTAHVLGSFSANTYCIGYLNTSITPDVYHSTDYGNSWTKKNGTGFAIIAIVRTLVQAGPNLLAGTSNGGVYKSTDNGNSWTASNTGMMPANVDIAYFALKGSDVYAGTSAAASVDSIYRSTDNGATWMATATTFFDAGPVTYLTGLTANAGALFASVSIKGVHRSTDNGATWVKVNPAGIPGTNFAVSILATASNLFIGIGGGIFRADQNGDTWDSVYTGLPPRGSGQSILNIVLSGTTIVASTNGTGPGCGIHRSTNNGDSWVKANAGLRALKINGMMASAPYLYIAGNAQGFFRSSDNGANWAEINNGIPFNAGWFCLARVGADILGGTSPVQVYRSSDNGDTWVSSNTGFTLTNVFDFFVEGSTVYATGFSGINKSNDGGLNWNSLPANFGLGVTGLALWKDGVNMLVGTNGGIKRSTNSGDTWDAAFAGFPVSACASFTQIGSTIFGASAFGVHRSTDGGATWSSANSGITGTAVLAVASRGTDLYAGTPLNGIFHSTDNGTSWVPLNDGLAAPIGVNKFAVTTNPHLFAGGTKSSVFSLPLAPTSVKEIKDRIPLEYTLGQNYPNPFNPQTRIEFSILKSANVKLEVFNVLGQNVTTLIDKNLSGGTYQVMWDGKDAAGKTVSSGTYFYRLEAGDFVETKKMNFVK
jgi:photosystem II stability/assembly factor-like uncharacterized protein